MADSMASEERDPLSVAIDRANADARAFASFLARLRDADPRFAEVSALHKDGMGEWQAAVYLLSGCGELWSAVGPAVMRERSLAPVFAELENPRRAWSGGEQQVLVWAAHFWSDDQAASLPYVFDQGLYSRWLVALHLRRGFAPDASLLG
jgi:hypothetical protein